MSFRTVVVSGANGGLGSFVTNRFLANGDVVIGLSRNIEQRGLPADRFFAVRADLSNPSSVKTAIDSAIEKHGRIDVVAHVAGGFSGGTPLHETEAWNEMLDQNLNAAFHLVRAVIPHMRRSGGGRFIAVGSKAAEEPHANLGAYVVSKSALVTMVKILALENSTQGITANLVLPGTMDTPGNRAAMPRADFSKWVSPAAVADAIYWLSTDAAAHVSGAAIPVSAE